MKIVRRCLNALLMVTGVSLMVLGVSSYSTPASPVVVMVKESTSTSRPAPSQMAISAKTAISVATLVPTVTATAELVFVQQYLLGGKINLSSGSTALTIRPNESRLLPGNWAEAVSYQETDPLDIFDPHAGTIYSFLGDTTVLQAHSGTVYGVPELFTSNLDLYLRKGEKGLLSFAEGQEKVTSLLGQTAFFCQSGPETVKRFTLYDTKQPCPSKLEVRIVAVGLVPGELVDDYLAHQSTLRAWMIAHMPEAGFSSLNPKTGFLLITCVGRYFDQPMIKGLPDFDYDKLVVGFEIVP